MKGTYYLRTVSVTLSGKQPTGIIGIPLKTQDFWRGQKATDTVIAQPWETTAKANPAKHQSRDGSPKSDTAMARPRISGKL